ncbi:FAD-binding oxidoreductase [Aspergillus neoniger CBS 115656]|uniref:Oxidoreductase n=1 Tax=Aspergillus neoniger (strain CBS 115656) TaxID=1448310 RepID=A0A318YPN1_ASPNB|nr:putative oxidoreductase [Aspergillus neoniger CBS 115656]PYH35827.1 putative oxidoreductase [Aspergillus neoniger CBS 115656]
MAFASLGACCLGLHGLLGPNRTFFPGSAGYNASLSSYFSLQESEILPKCIISPIEVSEVSDSIRYLTTEDTTCGEFAIRSGGHAVFAGAANIASGVTIDLSALDTITINDDRTVTVGVGATWGDVYAALEPLNLMVAGGRDAPVGVGGLSTGGGMSYFSPRVGWTCDTVIDYEVVLANGSVVHANSQSNYDLLVALRGGSNNFGVVTHVQLSAFAQNKTIWAGRVYYSIDTIDEQLQATAAFSEPDTYDEFSSLVVSLAWTPTTGAVVSNNIVYTKPEANPSAFATFSTIPSLADSQGFKTITDVAAEGGALSPDGYRELWLVTTYHPDLETLNGTWHQWNSSLTGIERIPGLTWSLSLQPLPPAIYARHSTDNSLGLSKTSGSLMFVLLSATWDDEADDAQVNKMAQELIAGIEGRAKQTDAYHPFKYLNYAGEFQEPIASYGQDSVKFLQRVSRSFDPRGVFQSKVPGGFKIPRW